MGKENERDWMDELFEEAVRAVLDKIILKAFIECFDKR